jgi:FtsP/CotA-like multicopper oxidase with cupredoxin domain
MKKRTWLVLMSVVVAALLATPVFAVPIPPPGGTPDYFGPYSNYANSPLPAGAVSPTFTIMATGAGYTAPVVTITDVYGTGTGATASVTLDVLGGIATVTLGAAGSGYIAPFVTITDPTGTGAMVSATITGPFAGGMRKFMDALPTLVTGVADTVKYPGSDYYEIALVEYQAQMHADLGPTTLRGYVQLNNPATSAQVVKDANGKIIAWPAASYLGPTIIATKDRAVRIKFTNLLPLTSAGGNLFIPTDVSVMGAGMGPDGTNYPQNRGTLHLHGGFQPWISDGTPHQWVTPAGEPGTLTKGVSTQPVPDMDLPSGDSMTFYYPNQQSGRLQFYHDHSYGITRLNVYAGEAAGYLIVDPAERALTNGTTAGIPKMDDIPLVIQDKSFVWGTPPTMDPTALAPTVLVPGTGTWATDPTWNWGQTEGSLWFPHVYMPNQHPFDLTGGNMMGRWDYALWFWPPYTGLLVNGELPNPYFDPINAPWESLVIPGTPNPSLVPEAFMDTPVVNGKAYPTWTVDPKPYRLRILNACNDRFLNLSLFTADPNPLITAAVGRPNTEVKMVPFNSSQNLITPFPSWWYTPGLNFVFDDRTGGVPDPTTRGPAMIQIGTEGGILPMPAVIRNQPVNYTYNRRNIVVLNVQEKALFMGPAERADVIVDFTNFAGKTLILYSDAPAPVPAADQRIDYYTGDMDQTNSGGAPSTQPGYGPNTRTIMQIVVNGAGGTAPVDDVNPAILTALNTALPAAFAATQDPIIVPQVAYKSAYPATLSTLTTNVAGANVSRIQDTQLTFTPMGGAPMTLVMQPKAIQELFETNYGRMNATLGVELPFTHAVIQTTIPLGYIDPPTEFITASPTISAPVAGDGTQIWKITHNGVDTHAIHFHLFTVQVINRVGWDNAISLPDKNEMGWKETVRMNPLEDIIVALRPTAPKLPFVLPDSQRLMDVTMPEGSTMGFAGIDPLTGFPVVVKNTMTNYGWEYVWHCHLLGHEENDMMRPMVFNTNGTGYFTGTDTVAPTVAAAVLPAPNAAGWNKSAVTVTLTATDTSLVPPPSGVAWITYSASGATIIAPTMAANPASIPISAEGITTLTYFATDKAGNIGAPQSSTVSIDLTKPTVAWGVPSPAANSFGWNRTNVSIPFTAADALSGVASATPVSPLVIAPQGLAKTGTVTVVDVAGNSATITSPGVNIDTTLPTVTAAANPASIARDNGNNGTNTTNVTISGTVTDALSGVDTTANAGTYRITDSKSTTVRTGTFTVAANGAYSFVQALPISNTGFSSRLFTISVSAKDKAGNIRTVTTTFRVL